MAEADLGLEKGEHTGKNLKVHNIHNLLLKLSRSKGDAPVPTASLDPPLHGVNSKGKN